MEKLNFIKWQMLSRLPGGNIYERVKNSMLNSELQPDNPYYYVYWKDLNKTMWQLYLLGTFKTSNDDYQTFIEWLKNNFQKDGFYEILDGDKVIKIPVPSYEDYKCFKAEFLDIIMPIITKGKMEEPFLEGPYEYRGVKLEEGDTVFDLGANYGLFSSLALSRDCQVYAFEPTNRVRNLYLKKLENTNPNFNVISKAVSNKTGWSRFYRLQENPSSNSIVKMNSDDIVLVPTISLDDFVEEKRIEKVDFIKADIEGAERLMLEGAKEILREFAPKLSICYYHRIDDLKLLKKLILEANPNYQIETNDRKIYAKVLKKEK